MYIQQSKYIINLLKQRKLSTNNIENAEKTIFLAKEIKKNNLTI